MRSPTATAGRTPKAASWQRRRLCGRSELDARGELQDAPRVALPGERAEGGTGHGDARRRELRVVGQVQQVDRNDEGDVLVNGEFAENLDVPVANAVGAQAVDVLRENARLVGAGLQGGPALEADEAGRRRSAAGPNRGRIVPHVDVLRVYVVVVQRLHHLVDADRNSG